MPKRIFILGIVALLALVAASTRQSRIAYHKWRLNVAVDHARAAGTGRPTAAQELIALFRGPEIVERALAVWQRHEDALVDLNVLARREFPISRQPDTETRIRIARAAEKVFGRQHLWSIVRSPTYDYAVLVTAPRGDMPMWEHLIYQLEEENHFAAPAPLYLPAHATPKVQSLL